MNDVSILIIKTNFNTQNIPLILNVSILRRKLCFLHRFPMLGQGRAQKDKYYSHFIIDQAICTFSNMCYFGLVSFILIFFCWGEFHNMINDWTCFGLPAIVLRIFNARFIYSHVKQRCNFQCKCCLTFLINFFDFSLRNVLYSSFNF
jgi:hypothetical protein